MLLRSKAYQVAVWILTIFVIIFVGQRISFIFHPLVVLIKTIFFPMLVAGIFYYLTNSLVDGLTRLKIPRVAAILIIYVLFTLVILFAVLYLSPILQRQLTGLITNFPRILTELDNRIQELQDSTIFAEFEKFEFIQKLSRIDYVKVVDSLVEKLYQNIGSFLGSVASFVVVLLTIPLLLFYMLKDGHKITPKIVSLFPDQYQEEARDVLSEMSDTIRSYIQGMVIVCLTIGVMVYIGYLIIGLDYALLLAAVAMITNIIPYFGPVIGTIPAAIIALMTSPWKAIEVIIIMFIANQLESHIVAPLIIGKKLSIHPVTIIVVLLTAGSIGGIMAVILGVPAYAIMKVIATHSYSFIRRLMKERNCEK